MIKNRNNIEKETTTAKYLIWGKTNSREKKEKKREGQGERKMTREEETSISPRQDDPMNHLHKHRALLDEQRDTSLESWVTLTQLVVPGKEIQRVFTELQLTRAE